MRAKGSLRELKGAKESNNTLNFNVKKLAPFCSLFALFLYIKIMKNKIKNKWRAKGS